MANNKETLYNFNCTKCKVGRVKVVSTKIDGYLKFDGKCSHCPYKYSKLVKITKANYPI